MKDFLLILRTQGSVWTDLSPEQLQKHIQNGGAYIGNLIKEGKLKNANPVDKGSRVVTGSNGVLKDGPFNESKEVIAGYFHITASDMDEAVEIAKANPIFNDIQTTIEIHPMMAIREA
ncbi:MAG TPA: YciI family protein [Mucilaginibacter sp.]|jgi:hypothetical protein|nr:YciI family protein [Mucilaginibacter sp.]